MTIRSMEKGDAGPMAHSFGRPMELMARYAEERDTGVRAVLVALDQGRIVGYTTLRWQAPYGPFREREIPEIVDLNVLADCRNRGIGSQLLAAAENLAATRSPVVGIGVGLYADYGPAQHIYATRGYVPDGRGVVYDGRVVAPGTYVRLDDALTLQLVKAIQRKTRPETA